MSLRFCENLASGVSTWIVDGSTMRGVCLVLGLGFREEAYSDQRDQHNFPISRVAKFESEDRLSHQRVLCMHLPATSIAELRELCRRHLKPKII